MLLAVVIVAATMLTVNAQYQPNWNSLDSRPLPQWYDEAKIGIFLHWGVFSVPSYGSEWFWWYWNQHDKGISAFMEKNYPPSFTYADFAPMFKAEFYDPNRWADIFEAAGAKYVVLTSKHHEGFTNWPSNVSFNWNSMAVGPKRDLVGDLATAIRSRTPDIHFGLYHSMFDWFNPLWLADQASGFKTNKFVTNKCMPELFEIINTYKPDILWSDGEWLAPSTYWNSTGFLAWLYNESPVKDVVITNDRWGSETRCKHGGFYSCEDKFNPGVVQKHKWENCMSVDQYSWGYRRNAVIADLLTVTQLIDQIASTVSCGGNILINVGPTSDGMIVPAFEERLRELGSWLKVNGEAIYSSKPWTHQNDTLTPAIWYTSQKGVVSASVYAIVLHWPTSGLLTLGAATPSAQTVVTMLGYTATFTWKPRSSGGLDIIVPPIPPDLLPSQLAWVFKLEHLA